jgi:hypothetical protein
MGMPAMDLPVLAWPTCPSAVLVPLVAWRQRIGALF